MASVLKKQILKQLSRFTKGLKEEDINLSTFKGEGELTSLELDENALMDVLDVPYWVRITSAKCDRVFFQVPFMAIKKVPMSLTLDKVSVEIETCNNVESMAMRENVQTVQPGKYKFINQVIDGMTIQINEVNITFRDPAFRASVQILKVLVQSKSPNWESTNLKTTRLKNEQKTQILIFKELTWQMIRIELYSTNDRNKPPIKLFTNDIICRLTIKKRLSDCFILGCKLAILIEELLCVFTDSQMKAALHYIDSLAGVVQKSTDLSRKKKAIRKLEGLPEYQAQLDQEKRGKFVSSSKSSCLFSFHDVIETSYHFVAQKINLHLSDDPGSRSLHPDLQKGGSIQIEVTCFQVDLYPYHLADSDRLHWGLYKKASSSFFQWLKDSQSQFWDNLCTLVRENFEVPDVHKGNITKYLKAQYSKLMTSCTVLRMSDFTVFRVQSGKKQEQIAFIKGDKERHKLPHDSKVIHAEFTYYYYPGDVAFPLPPSKFYAQLNPVQMNFDALTILWLNTFALNVYKSLMTTNVANQDNLGDMIYFDILIEAIMPRFIFEEATHCNNQKDRPKSLNLQTSRATLSNVRSNEHGMSRSDLANCVNGLQFASLFYSSEYPARNEDYHPVTEKLLNHAQGNDNVRAYPNNIIVSSLEEFMNTLSQELLWIEAKDIWCIRLDPVWGDFYGARAVGSTPVPFLEAFPLTLWVQPPTLTPKSKTYDRSLKYGDMTVLCYIPNLVSIQINHFQYLFLLRVADAVDELATYVVTDQHNIVGSKKNGSFVFAALYAQVEVTFVTSAQLDTLGKSGGVDDVSSSVVADSSSIATQSGNSAQLSNIVQTTYEDVGYVYDMSQAFRIPMAISGANSKRKEFTSQKSASVMYDNVKEMSQIKMAESVTTDINLPSFKGMKKRWFNFGASIDLTGKQNIEDFNDNVSVRSDMSSDSESLMDMSLDTNDGADVIFKFPSTHRPTSGFIKNIEMASEAFDDIFGGGELTPPTTSSERDSIGSSIKRKDLIAITTLKFGRVEILHQSEGLNSVLKLQVTNVSTEECPYIPWDEFQDKFTTRTRDWNEVEGVAGLPQIPRIMVRLEHNIMPKHDEKLTHVDEWKNDNLTAKVNNVSLSLNSNSLTSLADFFVDEQPSKSLPFEATIENTIIKLCSPVQNDALQDETTKKPTDTEIHLSRLKVRRTNDGLVCVEPIIDNCDSPDNSNQLIEIMEELKKFSIENEYLHRKLGTLERLKEENLDLHRFQEENRSLKLLLNEAQDNISKLLGEKQNLLDQVRVLKESKTNMIVTSKR